MFLILAIFLGSSPLPKTVAVESADDPFATMYDSDALFREKIAPYVEELAMLPHRR